MHAGLVHFCQYPLYVMQLTLKPLEGCGEGIVTSLDMLCSLTVTAQVLL